MCAFYHQIVKTEEWHVGGGSLGGRTGQGRVPGAFEGETLQEDQVRCRVSARHRPFLRFPHHYPHGRAALAHCRPAVLTQVIALKL